MTRWLAPILVACLVAVLVFLALGWVRQANLESLQLQQVIQLLNYNVETGRLAPLPAPVGVTVPTPVPTPASGPPLAPPPAPAPGKGSPK